MKCIMVGILSVNILRATELVIDIWSLNKFSVNYITVHMQVPITIN